MPSRSAARRSIRSPTSRWSRHRRPGAGTSRRRATSPRQGWRGGWERGGWRRRPADRGAATRHPGEPAQRGNAHRSTRHRSATGGSGRRSGWRYSRPPTAHACARWRRHARRRPASVPSRIGRPRAAGFRRGRRPPRVHVHTAVPGREVRHRHHRGARARRWHPPRLAQAPPRPPGRPADRRRYRSGPAIRCRCPIRGGVRRETRPSVAPWW